MKDIVHHHLRSWRWGLFIGALTGLIGGAFLTGFVVFVMKLDHNAPPSQSRADGIIALTGGADRIADAVGLLAAGRGKRLLITGVNPTISGHEISKHTPRFADYQECCIDLGYQAVNTAGNAEEARAWLQSHHYGSAIIVTAAYHMPRALAEIAQAVPHVRLIPHPVVPERLKTSSWWNDAHILRLMSVEYVKYLRTIVLQAQRADPAIARAG